MPESKRFDLENTSVPTPPPPWNPDPERIVEDYQRLAYSAANAYRSSGVPLDDLRQEALLGLLDAARKYSPDKGAKFSTYAMFWIRKRLTAAVKQDPFSSWEDVPENLPTAGETSCDPVSGREADASSADCFELPPGLSATEREILVLSYSDQLPLSEISRRAGISVERVKQLRAKALRRLRGSLSQRSPR